VTIAGMKIGYSSVNMSQVQHSKSVDLGSETDLEALIESRPVLHGSIDGRFNLGCGVI
jgi:hypothetical protein